MVVPIMAIMRPIIVEERQGRLEQLEQQEQLEQPVVVAMPMVALELAAIAAPMPDSTSVAMAIAAPVFTVNFAPQHSLFRLTR